MPPGPRNIFRCLTVRISPPRSLQATPLTHLKPFVHKPTTVNLRRYHASVPHLANTMGSQFEASPQTQPFKVLILGGCYAGLSSALNLIDLAEGRAARRGNGDVPAHDGKIPVDITIVDERDGYCEFLLSLPNTRNSCFQERTRMRCAACARIRISSSLHLKTHRLTMTRPYHRISSSPGRRDLHLQSMGEIR